MFGAIKIFRKSLLGGFNRRDVMSYIESLGRERNRYRTEKEHAEQETERLRVKLEQANIRVRQIRGETLDETRELIAELESACASVRAGIEETSFQIRSELVKVDDSIALMTSALHKTNERLIQMSISSADTEQESQPLVDGGCEVACDCDGTSCCEDGL